MQYRNTASILKILISLSVFLIFKLCVRTALPCPEEDYNTVVETLASKRSSAELRIGIEETPR